MKTIGIISLSNGLNIESSIIIDEIIAKLDYYGIKVFKSQVIYKENNLTVSPKTRAKELMNLYKNPEIDMIFDVSGGDLANGVLDYIDYKLIKENRKPFFGFSDFIISESFNLNDSKKSFVLKLYFFEIIIEF